MLKIELVQINKLLTIKIVLKKRQRSSQVDTTKLILKLGLLSFPPWSVVCFHQPKLLVF